MSPPAPAASLAPARTARPACSWPQRSPSCHPPHHRPAQTSPSCGRSRGTATHQRSGSRTPRSCGFHRPAGTPCEYAHSSTTARARAVGRTAARRFRWSRSWRCGRRADAHNSRRHRAIPIRCRCRSCGHRGRCSHVRAWGVGLVSSWAPSLCPGCRRPCGGAQRCGGAAPGVTTPASSSCITIMFTSMATEGRPVSMTKCAVSRYKGSRTA